MIQPDDVVSTEAEQTTTAGQDAQYSDAYLFDSGFSQQRLWFLDRLGLEGGVYNMPLVLRMRGNLVIPALRGALQALVARHEALRTTFTEEDGKVMQVVHDQLPPTLAYHDLSLPGDADERLRRALNEEVSQDFDLEQGPLLRAHLWYLNEGEHVLCLTLHHIVGDGWSLEVLVRDLRELYIAALQQRPAELPTLSVQYPDFAHWQREWLQGEVLEAQLDYWRGQLAGELPILDLPTDKPRPLVRTHQGALAHCRIDAGLTTELRKLAQQQGATLFMVLLAGFKLLLSRYSGQSDILVGTSVAGRSRAELENLIGFFVNTLVLRTDLGETMNSEQLIQRIRSTVLQAFDHQDLPFERLVEELQPERDLGHTPLFQAMFVLQNDAQGQMDFAGVDVSAETVDVGVSKFDIGLFATPQADGSLAVVAEYSTELFTAKSIESLLGYWQHLLQAMAQQPQQDVNRLALTDKGGEERLLAVGRGPKLFSYPLHMCEWFEAQVQNHPEAPALYCGERYFNYTQLNRRANQLAHRLREQGIGAEMRVALCLRRTANLPVAILAVLKAGAAYVPLDPTYPAERIAYMLADSGAALLIHENAVDLPEERPETLCLDEIDLSSQPVDNPPRPVDCSASLAYLIYTSGSTGRPKGVAIEHGNAASLIAWAARAYDPDVLAGVLASTSVCFDLSVFELFVPLSYGGAIVLVDNALELLDSPHAGRVTLINTVPSAMSELAAEHLPESLQVVNLAGEPLKRALADKVYRHPQIERLCNLYGPSEDTTYSTYTMVSRSDTTEPHIGRTLAGSQIYILDAYQRPVPPQAVGEIYIGGAGVTRGYFGRPALTAERFVPDPFGEQPGARLYRTGDLARFNRDGDIEFIGRADHQVKVRGFRIELGEIEAAILTHPQVEDALVSAQSEDGLNHSLTAYIAAAQLDGAQLRRVLSERLPAYMLPSRFVVLDSLPKTPNGKIDRKALAAISAPLPQSDDHQPPQGDTEIRLAQIWQEVLKRDYVGRNDHFFRLGGHSLLMMQLVSRIRERFAVDAVLRELFERPLLSQQAVLIDGWQNHGEDAGKGIEAVDRSLPLPLSASQQRLWFLDRLEGGALYNIPLVLKIRGTLDGAALQAAIQGLLDRHEILRTTYCDEDGRPCQEIHSQQSLSLQVEALSQPLTTALRQEVRGEFDLRNGPLLRARLWQLPDDSHVLCLTVHHIAADGWSMDILIRDLKAFYLAAKRGRETALPPLPVQYADYAAWQQKKLQNGLAPEQLDYWRERLSGELPVLELPTDLPRPAVRDYSGAQTHCLLDRTLAEGLMTLARDNDATLFMVLLAGFKLLVSRYSGQRDVLVGTAVAGRNRRELEGLIGFFVNTLVLRTDLSGAPDVEALLARVRETTLGAYQHQDMPFERLVEQLQPNRDLSVSPLFQVMFLLQNPPQESLLLDGLSIEPVETDVGVAKFDLSLAVVPQGDGSLKVTAEYSTELFEAQTIERMLGHWRHLLKAMVAEPRCDIEKLPIQDPGSEALLLALGDGGEMRSGPLHMCQWFEAGVQQTPTAPALYWQNECLDYQTLNRRANRLADELLQRGIGREQRVGICLTRTPHLPVAILAVLKAGAAYVPLDPAYPAERVDYMLADSRAVLLITEEGLLDSLPDTEVETLCLDTLDLAMRSDINPRVLREPHGLAYLIYTSGSTGKPKGVAIEHASAAAMIAWAAKEYDRSVLSGVLAATSMCFDLSVYELFVPLSYGGAVILADNALALPQHPAAGQVTLLNTVPSAMAELLRAKTLPENVRVVNLAGEPLKNALVQGVYDSFPVERVCNLYGPSEDTTYSTYALVPRASVCEPTIGRAISGSQIYLLDEHLRPVPPRAVGELYIGGAGLARGYFDRPAMTADRFIPDPFSGLAGARLYRTGDLGRFQANGEIEFLGRMDHQVKVRGFRIELGEVEAALLACDGVREVVVSASGENGLQQTLTAYVAGEDIDVDRLRRTLGRRLPPYMVPGRFMLLDALPQTPNGKVDRKALPQVSDGGEQEYIEPDTPTARALAAIWQALLGVERVGLHDHFFHLGGHSLLVMQLLSQMRRQFGVEPLLRHLFEQPLLVDQAARIDALLAAGSLSDGDIIPPALRSEPLLLSFSQQRLWFLDRLDPGQGVYNIPLVMRLHGPLRRDALRSALQALLDRHESLRTCFYDDQGRPQQCIVESLSIDDILQESRIEAADLSECLMVEAAAGFDLGQAPLLRLRLWCLGDEEHVLSFTLHHIITDGWSTGVLLQDLKAFYQQALGLGEAPKPLSVQYADYAQWQRRYLQGARLDEQLAYWRERLHGELPVIELPADKTRPAIRSHSGALARTEVDADLADGLRGLARQEQVTLFMVLLAGFKLLLSRYCSQLDILVGTPVAGRSRAELEDLIGFFVNTLVLRTDLSGAPTVSELLQRVRETTLGAYDHQDLPFEQLVEALQPGRDLSHTPLFQVLFALQGEVRDGLNFGDLKVQPEEVDTGLAKFDLSLSVTPQADGSLAAVAEYSTELFEPHTVARLLEHWKLLLRGMVMQPQAVAARLAMLSPQDYRDILNAQPFVEADASEPLSIVEHILRNARDYPEAIAMLHEGQSLSYAQLEQRTAALAQMLVRQGVGLQSAVAVCVERGPQLLEVMLAIWRIGAIYVPLDPFHPARRLSYMLADSGADLIISDRSQADLANRLAEDPGKPVLILCDEAYQISTHGQRDRALKAEHIAYIIYTSGSTGRPKGVAVPHRGLLNLADSQVDRFSMNRLSRTLQMASIGFDASIAEILTSLLCGGCLISAPAAQLRQADQVRALLEEHKVTVATLPPSLLSGLAPDGLVHLQTVISAGAALPLPVMQQWARDRHLFNAYGPTEATVCASIAGPCDPQAQRVTIGKAMHGVRLYVLDEYLQPQPPGVPGELYIGGLGVAQGYVGQSQQTAERFVPDPFVRDDSARLYRSGDLARCLDDGNIDYLGRIDGQIELRGYRIETAEIEAVLLEQLAIDEAAVVLHGESSERRLVAYVSGQGVPGAAQLRDILRRALPEPMVPADYVVLESLPKNASGKIDRRELAAKTLNRRYGGRSPRNALEHRLMQVWAEVLGLQQLGVDDDFFDLGGHSMKAVELSARLESLLGHRLSLNVLFEHRSVASLAAYLSDDMDGRASPALITLRSEGTLPPMLLLPPIGGSGFVYAPLAAGLKSDRPVYALQAPWLEDEALDIPNSLEAMAAHYLQILEKEGLTGTPLVLAGWSLGGLLAVELARQLEEGYGLRVPLRLIDPTPVQSTGLQHLAAAPQSQRLAMVVRDMLRSQGDVSRRWQAPQDIAGAYRLVRDLGGLPADLSFERFERWVQVYLTHAEALSVYEPGVFFGDVQLILANATSANEEDQGLSWWQFLPGLQRQYHLVCDHYGLLRRPMLDSLLAVLDDSLAELNDAPEQ